MWQYKSTPAPDELYHHGILGMKWGRRRYQNPDGTLTPAGKKRYAKETLRSENKQALARQQNSLKKLQSSGRGDDIDAVTKISNQYDADRKAAREKYRAEKKSIVSEQKSAMTRAAYNARKRGDFKEAKSIEAARDKGATYANNIMAGAIGGMVVGESLNLKYGRSGSMAVKNMLVGAGLGAISGTATATVDIAKGNLAMKKKNED